MNNSQFLSKIIPNNSPIKIIGIGTIGCTTVAHLSNIFPPESKFLIDSDSTSLKNLSYKVPADYHVLIGNGLGAGADIKKGEDFFNTHKDFITEVLANTKLLFIVTNLGKGTGSGVAPLIAKTALELGIMTVCFASTPFEYETENIINQAKISEAALKKHCNLFFQISYSKLSSLIGNNLESIFSWTKKYIEKGIYSFIETNKISEKNFSVGLDALQNKLFPIPPENKHNESIFAFGESKTDLQSTIANLYSCPCLNDKISNAYVEILFIHFIFPKEQNIETIKNTIAHLKTRFGGKKGCDYSYTKTQNAEDGFQIFIFGNTIKDDKIDTGINADPITQLEIGLNFFERGIFNGLNEINIPPFKNLDAPSYQRKKIELDN